MEGRLGRQGAQSSGSRNPAETVDISGTILSTVSAIGDHPALERLASRLNGDTERAMRLFHVKAREHKETGSVTQGQIIRHKDGSRPAVIGVQSGDSSPGRRVRAFFSREGNVYTLRAICRADEDGKVLNVLTTLGYRQGQRTSRA